MSNLAIIPARGGSKRIPRKNIKTFLGKPIIAYSIQAALDSKLFDEVMVSTDDMEIANIAIKYGAKVPFMRSNHASNDFATTADVIREVLLEYRKIGRFFETACCMYATAPFITSKLLNKSFELLQTGQYKTVIPIMPFSFPIQRGLKQIGTKIEMAFPEYTNSRSQDLEQIYHDAGQFYFLRTNSFLETNLIWTNETGGILISELEAHDIDNEVDWQLAEMKFKLINYL